MLIFVSIWKTARSIARPKAKAKGKGLALVPFLQLSTHSHHPPTRKVKEVSPLIPHSLIGANFQFHFLTSTTESFKALPGIDVPKIA